ncbi:MAG: CARDB domain-containing protein [Terriglobia bacterium]
MRISLRDSSFPWKAFVLLLVLAPIVCFCGQVRAQPQTTAGDEARRQTDGAVEPQLHLGQVLLEAPSIPEGTVTQPAAASTDAFGLNADQRKLLMANPAELARLLRERAIQEGVDIYAVPELEHPTDYAVHTERGSFFPQEGNNDIPAGRPQGEVVKGSEHLSPYIVQFARPVSSDEWLSLMELGGRPIGPLSSEAIVYLIPDSAVTDLTGLPFVRWVGAWMPEYKLNPDTIGRGKPLIYVKPLGCDEPEYLSDLKSLGFGSASEVAGAGLYTITASDADVQRISRLWWVKAIFRAPQEMPTGTVNFGAMDSRQFLLSPNLNYLGFNGGGVSVGVRDNGVMSTHADLNGIFLGASDLTVQKDHGTHVTGIVAGRGTDSSGSITGVAPGSSVLFRSWANSSDNLTSDLDAFQSNSVEISNHSYLVDCSNYDSTTEIFDNYAHDHGQLLVVSAGNENNGWGNCSGTHNYVTNPRLGKNTIAVGAISYTFDGDSGGLGNIAVYSSRGPSGPSGGTTNRLKPDLVAPGGDVVNACSVSTPFWMYGVVSVNGRVGDEKDSCGSDVWPNFSPSYLRDSGTSMAAPHVTGALALMRQWSPPSSSSSLALKAQLIAQTIPLRGQTNTPLNGYADTTYGYGLVNPYASIRYISGEWSNLLWAQGTVTNLGESDWSFVAPSGSQKIGVALAYNDADTTDGSLRDDLEFEVDLPSGIKYGSDSNGSLGCTTCIRSPFASGVNTESPVKKVVIVKPSSADLGKSWTVRVKFTQWPSWCIFPCTPNEGFGLVVEGIYKQPALALQLSQTSFLASPGQSVSIPLTVTNTGGYIIPAVGVSIDGTTPRVSEFLGPLIGQNSSTNGSLTLVAPSGVGTYKYTVRAMGVNLGLQDALAAISVTVGPSIAISNVSPSSVTLIRGGSAQSVTVNLTRTSYTGSITLAATNLPSGVTPTYTQPGTASSGSITLQASSSAALVSNQTITVTASGSGVTSATSSFSLTVTNSQPDLLVTSVSIPSSATVGGQVSLSATIKNQGSAAAGAFRLGFYLSTGSTITTSSTLIAVCSYTTLAVGATNTCAMSPTLPSSVGAGTYYGGAIVDDLNQVSESNESNNTLVASNTLTVTNPQRPDLLMTSVSFPSSATVGGQVNLSATIKNQGGAAAGAFRLGFYLSTGSTITTSSTLIAVCNYTSLAAGATSTCAMSPTLPSSVGAGTYYGGAIVDDLNQVSESNESNNTLLASNTLTVTGAQADLLVTSVSIPSSATVGGQVSLSATIKNQGGTAAGAFRMSFYLSTSSTISTSSTNIGYCTYTSLAAGATNTCAMSPTLPSSVGAGTYYGGAIVDDLNQVSESNESNNTLLASNTLTVSSSQADLLVTSVSIPSSATVGGQVSLSATIKNQGSAAAGAFRLGFYLSTGSTITTSSTLIAYCTYTSLAAGATNTCAGTVTLPSSVGAGTYHGGAIVDDLNQVSESNESNNTLLASNTLTVTNPQLPDLVVTSVSIPSSATVGGQASLSATIKNQGSAAAGAFRLGFYLSTGSTITTSSTLIAYCTYTSLAAGATNTCAGTVTLPSSVGAGTYHGGAIADDLNQVSESNESNNTLLASNTLTVK